MHGGFLYTALLGGGHQLDLEIVTTTTFTMLQINFACVSTSPLLHTLQLITASSPNVAHLGRTGGS